MWVNSDLVPTLEIMANSSARHQIRSRHAKVSELEARVLSATRYARNEGDTSFTTPAKVRRVKHELLVKTVARYSRREEHCSESCPAAETAVSFFVETAYRR